MFITTIVENGKTAPHSQNVPAKGPDGVGRGGFAFSTLTLDLFRKLLMVWFTDFSLSNLSFSSSPQELAGKEGS